MTKQERKEQLFDRIAYAVVITLTLITMPIFIWKCDHVHREATVTTIYEDYGYSLVIDESDTVRVINTKEYSLGEKVDILVDLRDGEVEEVNGKKVK